MSRRKLHADDYDDGFDDYDPRDYEQTSLHGSGGTELEPPPEGYHSDLRAVKSGSHVAGCFTEDGQWYPAVVDEVIPGEHGGASQYFVTYTQYGNSELLPAERVRAEPGSGPSEADILEAEAQAAAAAARAAEARAERESQLEAEAALGVGASPLFAALGAGEAAAAGGGEGQAARVVEAGQWDEAAGGDAVEAMSAGLESFQFDEPSPDDLVLQAQRQSKGLKKGGAGAAAAAESQAGGGAAGGRKAPIIRKKGAADRGGGAAAAGQPLGSEIFKSGEVMRAAPRPRAEEDKRRKKGGGVSGVKSVAAAAAKSAAADGSAGDRGKKRRLNLVVAGDHHHHPFQPPPSRWAVSSHRCVARPRGRGEIDADGAAAVRARRGAAADDA